MNIITRKREKTSLSEGKVRRPPGNATYCNHCKKFFMETKGTPLFRKLLSEDENILICKLLVEKNGIRGIERITGHHRDTIGDLLTDIAEHATEMNEFLIREPNVMSSGHSSKKAKESCHRMLRIRFQWRCTDLHKHKKRHIHRSTIPNCVGIKLLTLLQSDA